MLSGREDGVNCIMSDFDAYMVYSSVTTENYDVIPVLMGLQYNEELQFSEFVHEASIYTSYY
jgi:hypothetical protein